MVELLNSDPNFTAKYGDASQYDFRPPQMVTFWSFRFMIGLGMVAFLLAAWGLWATRGGRTSSNKWLSTLALVNLPLPFAAASFGWIFTEMGRQPWVVVPNQQALAMASDLGSVNMMTETGISPNVPAGQMLATVIPVSYTHLEPPLPPSPPSGPASGLNFSRLIEATPLPPLPPIACRVTRSTKSATVAPDD